MRTAISFCRPVARVSSRFATLAHAISSTSATDPSSDQDREPDVADDGLDERDDVDGERAVALVLVANPAGDGRDVRVRLRHRHARLQARHDVEVLVAAPL